MGKALRSFNSTLLTFALSALALQSVSEKARAQEETNPTESEVAASQNDGSVTNEPQVAPPIAQPTPSPQPAPPRPAPNARLRPATAPVPEVPAELAANPNDPANETKPQRTVWVAHVLRRKSAEFLIRNFELTENKLPIVLVAKDKDLRPTVSILGRFNRPGWQLLVENQIPVVVDPSKATFVIHAHLKGRINKVQLTAIGPNKEKESEILYIYAPEAMEFKVVSAWDQILLSLGTSYLSYAQAGFGEYRAISGLLSARYSTPENTSRRPTTYASRLGLIANGDLTVLTFVSSPVDRGPQLLELKVDGTYLMSPDARRRWRSQILFGASYLTMFNYGSPFGFANLIAPEIGIRGRYTVSSVASWVGEARFVGLSDSITLDQYGLNLSAAWTRLISDSHRLELGLSYSGYYYRPDPEIPVRLHQLSIKLGLSI